MTLIAAYLFTEASSGTTPATVGDSVSPSVNATITYGSGPGWTTNAGGRGLQSGTNQTYAVSASIGSGNKLYDNLHGASALTVECVIRLPAMANAILNVFQIGDAVIALNCTSDGQVSCTVFTTSGTAVASTDSGTVTTDTDYVIQFTWGSGVNSGNPVIYVNNVNETFFDNVGTGTINLSSATDRRLALLARADAGGRPNAVNLYALLVYNEILDGTTLSAHYTALLAANDVDPNAGGGDIEVSTGLAAETDSAQAPTRQKRRALGVSLDTSTALARTLAKRVSTGVASDTSSAVARQLTKRKTPSVAAETDTAQARALTKRLLASLASESDAAQAVALRRRVGTGTTAESDAATALDVDKRRSVGLAAETDTAPDLGFNVAFGIGVAVEADAALSRYLDKRLSPGASTETDSAVARALVRRIGSGVAVETETALRRSFALRVGAAVETDLAIGRTFGFSVDLALESDAAIAPRLARALNVGVANDVATAPGAFTFVKRRAIGVAVEADVAFSLYTGTPEGYPTVTSWSVGDRPSAASWSRGDAPSVSGWTRGIAA